MTDEQILTEQVSNEQISIHVNIYPSQHRATLVIDEPSCPPSTITVENGHLHLRRRAKDLDYTFKDPLTGYAVGLRLIVSGIERDILSVVEDLIEPMSEQEQIKFIENLVSAAGEFAQLMRDGAFKEAQEELLTALL